MSEFTIKQLENGRMLSVVSGDEIGANNSLDKICYLGVSSSGGSVGLLLSKSELYNMRNHLDEILESFADENFKNYEDLQG